MEDNSKKIKNQPEEETIEQTAELDNEAIAVENTDNEEQPKEQAKKSGIFSKKDKKSQQLEDLKATNEKLQAEKAEIHDKFLRLYSEFDNFRKRTQKEKIDIIKNASESVITQLLPIIDDMERAIAFNDKLEGVDPSIKEGLVLILQKTKTLLKQKGLEEIITEDQFFNTDFHEAVTTVPAEKEEDKGKILEEVQKGYTLNDKVIRYSKVVIYQ
ncbi:MAG TPA: nucleotide exchange factor GrpE [Bacteroidales bacterium]|nr:nucleotide exchange factor GrpE [Bacteroidales bacterium]HON20312.1 nucleotide exchange factor GrpE [Bacteroidales bacterium]HOR82570.1 nucleotide exchange factor GrpE [Bacteroidales bacterium]HPJ91735.1 nucleotide exchange factor GrpE [Bacteroidales bacterium]